MSQDSDFTDRNQPEALTESIHNDGQGISFAITFTPISTHPKARKNSKAKSFTKHVYINENCDFADFMFEVTESIKSIKQLSYKIVANQLRTNEFELSYSLKGTQLKNVAIGEGSDWLSITSLVKKGQASLSIIETKVSDSFRCCELDQHLACHNAFQPYIEGDDDEVLTSEDEGGPRKKKKKVCQCCFDLTICYKCDCMHV